MATSTTLTLCLLIAATAAVMVSAQNAPTPAVNPTPAAPPAAMADELQLNSNADTTTNNQTPLDASQQTDSQAEPPRNDLIRPIEIDEDFPPSSPFNNFFGRNNPLSFLFDSMRRHQQEVDQQFQQLRQQAREGQEVSYFSRNGISYVRTCTTKQVTGAN